MARATETPTEGHSHTHLLPDAEWGHVVREANRIAAEHAAQEAK